jgi:hypothetical protein
MPTSTDEPQIPALARALSPWIVRLIAAWILTGALFKLFLGSPKDLPGVVLETLRAIDLGTKYNLIIGVELVAALVAFTKPRWAWGLLAAILLVFELALARQISAGDASCGCFGSRITMPPEVMLAIDTALLLALVWSRPWTALAGNRLPRLVPLVGSALLMALPWLLDRELSGDVTGVGPDGQRESLVPGRPWVELDVASWVGQDVLSTPLARFTDLTALPDTGLWILYRHTCEHCRDHLNELAETEQGARMIALIRLRESKDTEANRVIERVPEGDFVVHAELPDTTDYVVTTPADLEVEGYVVRSGREGEVEDPNGE